MTPLPHNTPPNNDNTVAADLPADGKTDDPSLHATKHKTTGEKWFDALRFGLGEGIILGLTAAIAYVARYGRDSYAGIPNILKKGQQWITRKLMPEAALRGETPLSDNDALKARIAGAFASTTVLMHGGNFFIPVMKFLQDRKEHIVTFLNAHFGKPGEVEAGKKRVEHQTKESWGDVIKGRIGSWLLVFTSFIGADLIAGKDRNGQYRFDKFEEKFGRLVAGMTPKGKDIANVPVSEALTDLQSANKTYRFGKILALDFYATTAAVALWTTISKLSAIARGRKERAIEKSAEEKVAVEEAVIKEAVMETDKPVLTRANALSAQPAPKSFASRTHGKTGYRALAEREPAASHIGIS